MPSNSDKVGWLKENSGKGAMRISFFQLQQDMHGKLI